VRWFHSGGIMAGLSLQAPAVITEAMQAARQCRVRVSYDLNYRASLWQRFGGKKRAQEVNAAILPLVDVLFGVEALATVPTDLDPAPFHEAIKETASRHANLTTIATTMRIVHSAGCHDWSGLLWQGGQIFQGPQYVKMDIYDRVGAGDAFAAGIIHGLLNEYDLQKTIDYGVAHGALTMTTPGDNSMATVADLKRLLASNNAAAIR
jgi:2-dehydro-3-deoxygluconokinase